MLALMLVFAASLYMIGLRADRIHAGRAVEIISKSSASVGRDYDPAGQRTSHAPVRLRRWAEQRTDQKPGWSARTEPIRYRGLTASEWAARYRHRTRQLQGARRNLRHVIHAPAYGTHWLERAFLCIHAHEGPWAIHNPPYDGGLQMDGDFQRTYGDWALRAFGLAGNWPVSVQLAVAIRAYESGRGFYPWPNTARACGLI